MRLFFGVVQCSGGVSSPGPMRISRLEGVGAGVGAGEELEPELFGLLQQPVLPTDRSSTTVPAFKQCIHASYDKAGTCALSSGEPRMDSKDSFPVMLSSRSLKTVRA